MNITDFGTTKPTIQPYQNGYSIPVGLTQVERPGIEDGAIEHSWQGYLLTVAALTDVEFDKAIKQLPNGDYSAERLAVLRERVRIERRAAYPPFEDYLDGVAKGDDDQIAAYKAKCLEVKKQYPLPEPPAEEEAS